MHIGWLNTMASNNYCCLLESAYLSFDYIVWQIKLQKSMHAWMRGRGDRQGLKTKLSEKHNSCPAQKMPLSSSISFSFPNAQALVGVNTNCLTSSKSDSFPRHRWGLGAILKIYDGEISLFLNCQTAKTTKHMIIRVNVWYVLPAFHNLTNLAKRLKRIQKTLHA